MVKITSAITWNQDSMPQLKPYDYLKDRLRKRGFPQYAKIPELVLAMVDCVNEFLKEDKDAKIQKKAGSN